MKSVKYIKACPFLRDLGDSYLCVNNDKVVDVIIDPLLNIEWSEDLPPVASEIEGHETCLFVLEVKDDGKLFCISRNMYLKIDKREIIWNDIRDSVYLLDLNSQEEFQDTQIDFCSTCLYKVLIASSPAFQSRLDYKEKIKLGWGYILYKANEIYKSIVSLSEEYANSLNSEDNCESEKIDLTINTNYKSSLGWLAWIIEEQNTVDELFASTTFEWLQKFDEWALIVSKIADAESDKKRIEYAKESLDFAAKIKELSFEILMRMSYLITDNEIVTKHIEKISRIISIASVQFDDYMFICNQFFSIIDEKAK